MMKSLMSIIGKMIGHVIFYGWFVISGLLLLGLCLVFPPLAIAVVCIWLSGGWANRKA